MGRKVARERAIAALIEYPTIKEAAGVVGVAEKTLHAWLKDDAAFRDELRAAQDRLTERALDTLLTATGEAVNVLRAVMSDSENPAAVRISAARSMLDNALKIYDTRTITRRIERLEELASERA